MKYKVWKQAAAILKPQPQHHATIGLFIFLGLLLLSVIIIIRLAINYAGNFYEGEREPYLQMLSSHAVTIRWQTLDKVRGSVRYGVDLNNLDKVLSEQRATSEHEIRLQDLQPSTRYFYQLDSDHSVYRQGEQYWFVTAPPTGDTAAIRVAVLGDPGLAGDGIEQVKSGLQNWLKNNKRPGKEGFDFVVSTGDNAYKSGSNEAFQLGYFDVFAETLKNYMLWPAYGNHEARRWAYYNIFSLPQQAESGGLASGTERYFSVDYGPLHLVFLDSVNGGQDDDEDMLRWLAADLENTGQKWIVAVVHHPPYSRGSHNSNDAKDSDYRMFNVRNRIVPVLEQAGIDVVLSGHSHSYERSHLIDCHYDLSASFDESMLVQRGNVFSKPGQREAHQGSVFVVHGASAFLVDKGPLNHPAMATSLLMLGSMIIDIEQNKLTGYFIDGKGAVKDNFIIEKDPNKPVDLNRLKSCH